MVPNLVVCLKIQIKIELKHLLRFDSSLAAVGLKLTDI